MAPRDAWIVWSEQERKWKLKATRDKNWLDQLSPPNIPTHLRPFVNAG
jgi:hypothetical protein